MALIYADDNIMDNGLNYLSANGTVEIICEGQPANYTEATTLKSAGGKKIASSTPSFTGPTDGSPSGRQMQIDALSSVTVDETGYNDYVAIVDGTGNNLLLAIPQSNAAVTNAATLTNTFTISGDHTSDIGADDDVSIVESTLDDGFYTVASVSLNGSNTDVVVNESISDGTGDGYMVYGTVKINSGSTVNIDAFEETIADVSAA